VFPNPCNASARISFALQEPTTVTIGIYDVEGRLMWSLASPLLTAGRHTVIWPGCDSQGRAVPSGIYLLRARAAKKEALQKMVLCR